MQLPDINLRAIADPAARVVITQLLAIIEAQHAELVRLRAENQQLRDEIARLKGGSGRPEIRPPPSPPPTNRSSEAERYTPTAHRKRRKAHQITPTRIQRCPIDPATLPPDATLRDTTVTVVHDLRLVRDIVAFHRETWYSPTTGCSTNSRLPPTTPKRRCQSSASCSVPMRRSSTNWSTTWRCAGSTKAGIWRF